MHILRLPRIHHTFKYAVVSFQDRGGAVTYLSYFRAKGGGGALNKSSVYHSSS